MKDDYVKFIRFAQWKIAENNGQGIIGYITNGFYLDGLGARGMRKNLRTVFDEIWVIDLHGNKEKGVPEHIQDQGISIDENVFEGVGRDIAITFFIRYPHEEHDNHKCKNSKGIYEKPMNCIIKYSDIWGLRSDKFNFLKKNNINTIDFVDVGERMDHEFTPRRTEDVIRDTYESYPYLCSIFLRNSQGALTAHDTLISNVDKKRLETIIENFYSRKYDSYMKSHIYSNRRRQRVMGKKYKDKEIEFSDGRDFQIDGGFKGNAEEAKKAIIMWSYRGFDRRYVSYYKPLLRKGSEQFSLLQYLFPFQENCALIVNRQSRGKASDLGSSVFISDTIIESMCNEGSSGLHSYAFPLKVNLSPEPDDFNNPKIASDSNINPRFKKLLPYNIDITDEDIFHYIYGILYTPKYRKTYKHLIRLDFPRIPFPKNSILFQEMVKQGKTLAELHLLVSERIRIADCPYNLSADDEEQRQLRRVVYDDKTERIYFNIKPKKDNNFVFWIGGISQEVWDFEIGGRKQIKEWMNTRRYTDPSSPKKNHIDHALQHKEDELDYLRKMVSAIKNTLKIQFGDEEGKGGLNNIFAEIIEDSLEFDVDFLNELVEDADAIKRRVVKKLDTFI